MNIPGFTADASLKRGATQYAGDEYDRGFADGQGGKIIPALPNCHDCDRALDRCLQNGWRPAGLCNLCAAGACN